MLEIWGRKNSGNLIPVIWTVGELGLEFERHSVGGSFGGLDTAAFGKLNPNRRIPTINDDGRVLWESQAIIRYLSSEYGAGTLWSTDAYQRAIADQWPEWTKTTVLPHLMTVFFGCVRTALEKRDPEAIAAGARAYAEALELIEQQLRDRPFIAGEDLTMGDITLGAYACRYYNVAIERPSRPRVEGWYDRLCARPAYQERVMIPFGSSPQEWLALERAGAG